MKPSSWHASTAETYKQPSAASLHCLTALLQVRVISGTSRRQNLPTACQNRRCRMLCVVRFSVLLFACNNHGLRMLCANSSRASPHLVPLHAAAKHHDAWTITHGSLQAATTVLNDALHGGRNNDCAAREQPRAGTTATNGTPPEEHKRTQRAGTTGILSVITAKHGIPMHLTQRQR